MLLTMTQDCRIYFGGAIERRGLRGSLRRRFYRFLVKFPILMCGVFGGEGKGREKKIKDDMLMLYGIDADVLGLWANIESAVYEELKSEQAGSHENWDGYHHKFVAKSA